jgi:mRNA interferase RelE/StbE
MRFLHSKRSRKQYANAPPDVQKAFEKQVRLLVENLRHPSLRAKKYDEANDIWQARINQGWRFYFQIKGDFYVILALIAHPK